jgi:histidine ammonia-lyase
MTVVLTGRDLTRSDLIEVARRGRPVALDPAARTVMAEARSIVDERLERGDLVYGHNTAVGVLKRVEIAPADVRTYSRRMLRDHVVAQRPEAPPALVRATMVRLANAFASGDVGVRPELFDRLVAALNAGETPRMRSRGSIGQADLAPMADLAVGLFGETDLAAGEGLALVTGNAFATAASALAVDDAAVLLDALDVSGAVSLEAIGANLTLLHPAIATARPYPGIVAALARLTTLLEGSHLWRRGSARNLQDPLTFRNLPQLQGAYRDVLAHVDGQLAIELNASQGNPLVVRGERRVVSVANFEILPLVAAIDYLRIVMASALTAAGERVVKLLETTWSGLPTGLARVEGTSDPGLGYLGIAVQALVGEARSIAGPISYEMASTSHAEGIEDRATMAPLAARRLAEMAELGHRIAAIELVVAVEATGLRGQGPLGRGTAEAIRLVRACVPSLAEAGSVPDVEPLLEVVAAGAFGRLAREPAPAGAGPWAR